MPPQLFFVTYVSVGAMLLMNMVTASVLDAARSKAANENLEYEVQVNIKHLNGLLDLLSEDGSIEKDRFMERAPFNETIEALFMKMNVGFFGQSLSEDGGRSLPRWKILFFLRRQTGRKVCLTTSWRDLFTRATSLYRDEHGDKTDLRVISES